MGVSFTKPKIVFRLIILIYLLSYDERLPFYGMWTCYIFMWNDSPLPWQTAEIELQWEITETWSLNEPVANLDCVPIPGNAWASLPIIELQWQLRDKGRYHALTLPNTRKQELNENVRQGFQKSFVYISTW